MADVARERHLTVDAGAFADAWRSKYLPYLLRIRNGEMPWQVLDGVHRASLRELLAERSLQSHPGRGCASGGTSAVRFK